MAIYELDGRVPELPADGQYFIADTADVIGNIVYRTRDKVPGAIRPIRRGWAPIGTLDRTRDRR